jgi:NAD(P)H-hydrate epimerase
LNQSAGKRIQVEGQNRVKMVLAGVPFCNFLTGLFVQPDVVVSDMHEVLTVDQMYRADRLAIAGGVAGIELMENAGAGVVEVAQKCWPQMGTVVVLCGPGNNGGDGFVVARLLAERGVTVRVFALAAPEKMNGDAGLAAQKYNGPIATIADADFSDCDVIVDGLFGAGLSRDVDGVVGDVIGKSKGAAPVLAIDVPSGIDGDSGKVRGVAFAAAVTVTFFRRKPAHLLLPGRGHCGDVHVVQIGIDEGVLEEIRPQTFVNDPALWRDKLPSDDIGQHKYHRGHVVCVSGGHGKTGAARLAARGALRAGAGLVSVACQPDVVAENAAHLTAIMIKAFSGAQGLEALLQDRRYNSVVIGPGLGLDETSRGLVDVVLASGAQVVVDADGLMAYAGDGRVKRLCSAVGFAAKAEGVQREVVMTPHEGEFSRLFDDETLFKEFSDGENSETRPVEVSKLNRTLRAARASNAIVVHKGADTVIAGKRGVVINNNAPASLATAGSGDVLAGIIAGLQATGMCGFDAACAGVWMHGQAAKLFGPGLIAEDLPEILPKVWCMLR